MEKKQMVNKEVAHDWFPVAPGVWGMKDLFVNIYMIHNPADNTWVLVDTGIRSTARKIRQMAAQLFSPQIIPSAIIMTHGHFDHTGSLVKLSNEWHVPVYAHHLELPYLSGKSSYPPPDPFVGGGAMSLFSWMFPRRSVNVSSLLHELPDHGKIPVLPEWEYIHTPGHAPGHISLFRHRDGVLLSGDAIVTTKQESAFAVMMQTKKLSGPPKYFTTDWEEAKRSAFRLAALEPEVIASGHGQPMRDLELREAMPVLIENFDEVAIPDQGRYVDEPATANEDGVEYIPPFIITQRTAYTFLGFTAGILLAWMMLGNSENDED